MSTVYAAIKTKEEICRTHPALRDELNELIDLAADEVSEGGSAEHEWELCIQAMRDLVDETKT